MSRPYAFALISMLIVPDTCNPLSSHPFRQNHSYPSSFVFKDNHVPAAFAPTAHIFYGERVMDLDDDIPKVSCPQTIGFRLYTLILRTKFENSVALARGASRPSRPTQKRNGAQPLTSPRSSRPFVRTLRCEHIKTVGRPQKLVRATATCSQG